MKGIIKKSFPVLLGATLIMGLGTVNVNAASSVVKINKKNFPDASFRGYVSYKFDLNKDGKLSKAERNKVKYIDFLSESDPDYGSAEENGWTGGYQFESLVKNMKGIEYFTKLEELDCSEHMISSLDVSKNTALKSLSCSNNNLTSLDVSKNINLESLACSYNDITKLKLTKNKKLTTLDASFTKLAAVNLKKNKYLKSLTLSSTELTALDLTKNTRLVSLFLDNNTIKNLKLPLLKKIQQLYIAGNNVKTLDLSNCKKLAEADISGLGLKSVVLPEFEECSFININDNKLKKLTFKGNIEKVDASNNALTKLNVSSVSGLEDLVCGYNKLTTLNVSKNKDLRFLDCTGNQLTTLDISKNENLQTLYAASNLLTDIVTGKGELITLDCNGNNLSYLDLSGYQKIIELVLVGNSFTDIKFDPVTKAKLADFKDNQFGVSIDPTTREIIGDYSCMKVSFKGAEYYVNSDGTASLYRVFSKKIKNISVPNSIISYGKKYKVTEISGAALENCKLLRSVTIGSNVRNIEYSAFDGCKNLTVVKIKSKKIKKMGLNAFYATGVNTVYEIPKRCFTTYKKLLRKAGAYKKAKYIKK